MKEKLLALKQTKLSPYQRKLVDNALDAIDNNRELAHNTSIFVERMYNKRFDKRRASKKSELFKRNEA
jgi:hypothetical protein